MTLLTLARPHNEFFFPFFSQGGRGGDPENEQYDEEGPQGFSRDIQMTHADATHEADEVLDDDGDDEREEDKEPSDGEDLDENLEA